MLNVKASFLDGSEARLRVPINSTIIDFKQIIKNDIKVSSDERHNELILMLHGVVLKEDNSTLREYSIEETDIFDAIICLKGGTRICAKMQDKIAAFEIVPHDTILSIKKKIEEKFGVSPDEQKLVFAGVVLEDAKTAADYNLVDESQINVVCRQKNQMQIMAKMMDGKTVAILVTANELISDVKQKIHEKIGLLPDEQRLVYLGKMLEDEETVDGCNIKEKNVICVVARLRGGLEAEEDGRGKPSSDET